MFCKVNSGGLLGIDGYLVQVEADVSTGLPGFQMVGYLASEVREAEERVRTAMRNSGFQIPAMKVTINLSPADIRKEGTAYDLPIAVAVLAAYGDISLQELEQSAFVGELGLDGRIKPVRGVLSLVSALKEAGIRRCFLAAENVAEGAAIEAVGIVKVHSLQEVAELLNHPEQIQEVTERAAIPDLLKEQIDEAFDFSEVSGQMLLRRATEVAVAGRHNLLYIGPPGSGKSMVARRIPTIMPVLSREEQLEISKVYSICGLLPAGQALLRKRPFRSPHHTTSPQALAGGGISPKPGEISLASRGVLFLDELPEFQKRTLEILRQPLEEHRVIVARVHGRYEFPANFMLVAALNPCPCGFFPDRERCTCTEQQVRKYLGKISGPLLDRIDICAEAAPISFQEIRGEHENETSETIRKRVEAVRDIQRKRFAGAQIHFNGEMGNREIRQYCKLLPEDEQFLQEVFEKMKLSARGCNKILKVARTIADIEGELQIRRIHLYEAIGYRNLEDKYWGKGYSLWMQRILHQST